MATPPPPRPELPTGTELTWPTVEVLQELGGSGTNQEILEAIVAKLGLTEDQQSVMRSDGLTTELYSRLALARTYLRSAGAIEQSSRGVWAITESGREMTEADTRGISGRYQASRRPSPPPVEGEREEGAKSPVDLAGSEADASDDEVEETWKDRLLFVLRDMDPSAFERLAVRLLREAGFVNTTVTGQVGDGGIDGSGVYRMSLISFPVYFQCKRYSGTVTADKVRDFRGAMEGRGDKGLLITTGTFTSAAKKEATREGTRPIDLIDGDQLCDLLRQYGLGISVTTVEKIDIAVDFFAEI